MNPNEICGHEECGKPKKYHNSGLNCPVMKGNDIIIGFHPTNRFTPRKEGQADKCPNCYAKMTPNEDGTSMCMECFYEKRAREVPYPTGKEMLQAGSSDSKACPPGRPPFDLDKALKGARLVTRDGQDADRFGRSNSDWCYAFVDGCRYVYNLDGRHRSGITGLDLFLAGEEDETPSYPCSKCGAPVDGLSSISLCLECQRKWKAENPFPPPPETQHQPLASMLPTPQEELEAVKAANAVERKAQETETQRQAQAEVELPSNPKELADFRAWCKLQEELAAQPKSEIDRQIEVIKASRENGAVVECCGHGQNNWEPVPNSFYAAATRPFNWASYDYRIKPAETKPRPRVVWASFSKDGTGDEIGFQRHCIEDMENAIQFIELNWLIANTPEVLSSLKAAGIEAGGEVEG